MESKEENNRRKKFVGIFQKDIFPCLRTYEVARQRFFKKRVKTIILMIFSVVIAVFLCSFSFQLDASFNYIVFLLPFLFVVYMCNEYTKLQEKEKSLIEEIKKQCIPKILNLFDDITWIKKETRILSKDLDKSGLFLKYNDMITDDCFIGKYNNISFSVSEIKLIKENMFHDKIKFNIFSGIVFLFHLDKYVKNRTIATAKREFLINSVHFIDVATFILILIFIYKNIDFGCALLDIKIIFIFLILIIAICVIIYFEVSTRIKEENTFQRSVKVNKDRYVTSEFY